MSWLSDLWSPKPEEPESKGSVSLAEFERDYELVSMGDTADGAAFIVATPKKLAERTVSEIGTTSASPWTSFIRQEYNPALQGLKGLEIYDKMRKSDGTVRGTLRSIKMPALSGSWFVEAGEDTDEAREIAKFIWCNLTEYMSITWTQVLTEALLMLDFGNYMFEKVWENRIIDGEMRTVLAKLAPRHPMDIHSWVLDSNGGPKAVKMCAEVTPSNPEGVIEIPIDRLLVFTFDRESGNMEGISVLRSAYKHWYFKEQLYKIDAIQKERHGIGIPVIKLPMGYQEKDRLAAENLGRNIRTNERAHVVLPPGWEITMLKLEGQPVDCLKSVEHHNAAIRENILVNFIGDRAQEADLVMFHKAARFTADIVSETFTTYLIREMVDKNYPGVTRYPKLRVRRIGESADWRTLSFAIRNFIGAGVIVPDEQLEANIREQMDLPLADPDSARLIATPQNPYDINEDIDDEEEDNGVDDRVGENSADMPHNRNNLRYNRRSRRKRRLTKQNMNQNRVGLPRQSPVGNTQNTFGLPRSNGGRDGSGR